MRKKSVEKHNYEAYTGDVQSVTGFISDYEIAFQAQEKSTLLFILLYIHICVVEGLSSTIIFISQNLPSFSYITQQ